MRKNILFAGVILLFAACSGNGTKTTQASSASKDEPAPNAVVHKTLNGVDEAEALKMIANFESTKDTDTNPTVLSYFLNKDMLQKMVDLLLKEESISTKYPTDGIRIYFGKKTATDKDLTLLLVSTTSRETDPAEPQKTHRDYYVHDANAPLFSSSTNFTIQPEKKGAVAGTSLYTMCRNCPEEGKGCDYEHNEHYLRRSYAETMVRTFGDHAINTNAEWFDLQMFKDMVADPQSDGIRIYLATHHDNTFNYKGRDAFVLTTTKKGAVKDTHEDYFDCNTLKEYFKAFHAKNPLLVPINPGRDNGELCPTNCN